MRAKVEKELVRLTGKTWEQLFPRWDINHKAIRPLTDRERQVLELRKRPTLESVARQLGLTRQRVQQIERSARNVLRERKELRQKRARKKMPASRLSQGRLAGG